MYQGDGVVWQEPCAKCGVPDAQMLKHALTVLQCIGMGGSCNSNEAMADKSLNFFIQRSGLNLKGTAKQVLLERTKRCIESNADDEDFSVEKLASALHMSRASLHRKLTAAVGVAPGDYIRHVRLEMAQKMLLECEDSVSTVAYAVGFETLSGFSRAFTAHFGFCPSRCRKKAA